MKFDNFWYIKSNFFQNGSRTTEDFINKLLPSIQSLSQKIPKQFNDDTFFLPLVKERLEIELAKIPLDKLCQGAQRIINLYLIALSIPPQKPILHYLNRLSRCYIWGFDPECIMLCRSVIDSAFKKAVNDKICKEKLGDRGSMKFSLNDRITVGHNIGLLDEQMKETAIEIKDRGNNAVHVQPDNATDVLDAITKTIAVLEKIHRI